MAPLKKTFSAWLVFFMVMAATNSHGSEPPLLEKPVLSKEESFPHYSKNKWFIYTVSAAALVVLGGSFFWLLQLEPEARPTNLSSRFDPIPQFPETPQPRVGVGER